jgi:tetratricopeptide (TPR) repeat protein
MAGDTPAVAVAKAERLLWQGKMDAAHKILRKLADQDDPVGLIALSHYDQRLGSLDDARVHARRAVGATESGSPAVRSAALVALANLTLRAGSGAEALALARRAVQAQPTPLARAALARALGRSSHHKAALREARAAVAADPTSMATRLALGEALLAGGGGHDAVKALRQALELKPNTRCTLCDAYVPELIKVRLAAALAAQGITAEAIVLAQEAAEAHPQLGEAFAVLGTAILADDPASWDEAIYQAQQGAFLEPKNPVVRAIVGDILAAGGNVQHAEAAFAAALETDPAYVPARVGLIHVRVRQRDIAAAERLARELTRAFPDSGEAQLTLARILIAGSDHAAAIAPLQKAVDRLPAATEPVTLLTSSYRHLKQYGKAADTYARVVAGEPENAAHRTLYGQLLGLAGRHEEAIAELTRASQAPGPAQSAALVNLGWLYRTMSPPRLEDSVAAYERALELDPDNAGAAMGLGWTHKEAQDWDAAIAAFQRAAQSNAETAGEAYLAIARCHVRRKDTAQARVFLAKAKEAGRKVTQLERRLDEYDQKVAENEQRRREYEARLKERRSLSRKERQLVAVMEDTRAATTRRIEAANQLARLSGGRAVPALLWLLSRDDLDLQEAAAIALGRIGPAAAEALPTLMHILEDVPTPKINPTPEEAEREVRQFDVRRAVRDAVAKIKRR